MALTSRVVLLSLCLAIRVSAASLPAGTQIEIRLRNEVNTFSSQAGQPISAVVIAPVAGAIPAGTVVQGQVAAVRRVGLGLVHETARLELQFDALRLPGGYVAMDTQVLELDNARERVDAQGRIRGIRSTATPGHAASGILTSVAAVDPIALLFTSAAFRSVLNFSEPEITLPAGTEIVLRLRSALKLPDAPTPAPPAVASGGAKEGLMRMVRALPWRTMRASTNEESDITNLVFIGQPDAVARAFAAAGWVEPSPTTAAARYNTLRAVAQTKSFVEAPMSLLELDGHAPQWNFAKTLNTFSKRHHLRIYRSEGQWEGQPVYTAAATHDNGLLLGFRKRPLDHRTDERIDHERSKVANDLMYTGCVDAAELVPRPWIKQTLVTAGGLPMETDRAILVLRMNGCGAPREFLDGATDGPGPRTGVRPYRGTRQAILTARNDLIRGNVVFQGVAFALRARTAIRSRRAPVPAVARVSRETVVAAPDPLPESALPLVANRLAAVRPAPPEDRGRDDEPPHTVEITFQVGGLLFRKSTSGEEGVLYSRRLMPGGPVNELALTAGNRIDPGWAAGVAVTTGAQNRVAHEWGLNFQRGNFDLQLARLTPMGEGEVPGVETQRTGLLGRQVSYSTVIHFARAESAVRPYVIGGPALQLVHFTDAPFKKARGVFRLGLANVGMFRAAYNFGSANPLEGGGLFQMAGQAGAGVKLRINPRWWMRIEYRDTFSQRPNFLQKSLRKAASEFDPALGAQAIPLAAAPSRGRFVQQRLTVGFSFAF